MRPHQTVAINVQIFLAGGGRITIVVAKENEG